MRRRRYRLAGEHLEHVCCRHLYGNDRLLTAWPSHDEAVVIFIAPHNRAAGDVYDLLLDALDVDVPIDQRDKPSCCDEAGDPPGDAAAAQAIADAIETVAKQRRRR